MPRPKKTLRPEDYVAVAAMAARGLRKEDVARRLGMGVRTLDRVLEEDERARQAFDAGRSELHEELVGKLVAKAREGDKACLIFALKSIFKYRENSPIEVEHEHRVSILLPAALSPDQYARLVQPGQRAISEGDVVDVEFLK